MKEWFRDSLLAVAGRSIAEKDIVDRLVATMSQSPSPADLLVSGCGARLCTHWPSMAMRTCCNCLD